MTLLVVKSAHADSCLQEEATRREARRRRIIRARLRGLQAANKLIEGMGGVTDEITWDDLAHDFDVFGFGKYGNFDRRKKKQPKDV